jgi:Ser/Thr protein kinase RdoA (MazF antagonist)
MRQNYPTPALQGILDQFPEMGTITESNLFTTGFENTNYYVKTDRGEYVIKVFEKMNLSRENILFEIGIMDKLFNSGIKSPKIFSTNENNLHASIGGKYAIVMNYIDGTNLAKQQISDTLAEQIGGQIGKMDMTLQEMRDSSTTRRNYEFDLKYFLDLEPKIKELHTGFDQKLFTKIFNSFKTIKPVLATIPSGLIQNDIALHNIIAKGNNLEGIIDYSDLVFSPYIQNIATACCQCFFTYNWQPHQAKIFLSAYRKYNSLNKRELELLYVLILARFASIIIEFNHLNSVFGEDTQRTEFITDNFRFLKKFLQIKESEFHKLIK